MCKLQLGHVFAAVSGVGPREELLGKRTVCAIVLQEPPELSKPDLYFFLLTALGLAAQDLSPAVGAGATLWWGRRGLTSRRLLLLWRQVLGMWAPAVAARGFQSAVLSSCGARA